MNSDSTTHRSGYVSPEGSAADGIVKSLQQRHRTRQPRTPLQRTFVVIEATMRVITIVPFAQRLLNAATGGQVNACQMVTPSGAASYLYHDASVIAPNNLYNAALKVKGATRVKGPSSASAKPYPEYYGKHNRSN